MSVVYTRINAPSKRERLVIRLIIAAGLVAMVFFLRAVFGTGTKGYFPLYICLSITIGYLCLKYLHEWYHYFMISAPPVNLDPGHHEVDIFTTFCPGEPYDMLETTLKAISEIRYPHTGWCCDEGDDPVVKDMCRKYGIRHVTRIEKKNAKAGNINNALQFATGDICVILDPDHVPAPEFLDIVLPYFDDPEVGYVQVVQAYKNHGENLIAKGAAQQTYQFYGPMMMSMHAYGTVQAIGANCTFRRSALDSIGGHAAGLAEDMHTAMRLHAKGWRSIYVPAVITRGLVPSTLEAYYKQQLKWSRGTFDLLVIAYPKLFRKFTLFQKIHYLLLPFHYLSGLIILLNFLVPVLSLLMGESPLDMDFLSFLLASFPLICITVLIRHYVQKWVVEETERGFHIVGGLLQIGTWWIHLTGFIYTLIRKKVPYIPTPKNDDDPTPFRLHLPNLLIIGISLFAIVYGLYRDWTPFSLFMSGFAMVNILVLSFVIYASYQKSYGVFERPVSNTKRKLWILRHWLYRFAREHALILSCLVTSGTVYAYLEVSKVHNFTAQPLPREKVFYYGVYQPSSVDGLTDLNEVYKGKNDSLQIISLYTRWTDTSHTLIPVTELEQIYQHHAVPLLTLEPDLSGTNLYDSICAGKYDGCINVMAGQLAKINKPLFIRFAQEPDNPEHSWMVSQNSSPSSYIKAWQHVHEQFERNGANKLVWVYNPWKPETAQTYFPGTAYVDWIGVDVLNHGSMSGCDSSFEALYRPFHNTPLFQAGLPVLLAETGTLSQNKTAWWDTAWNVMDTSFSEIRGVVVYNNRFNRNSRPYTGKNQQSWFLPISSVFRNAVLNQSFTLNLDDDLRLSPMKNTDRRNIPDTIRSTVYDKGVHWFKNIHTASEKVLQQDFASMKDLNVNTIFRTLPDIYEKNVFKQCQEKNIKIIPQLWASLEPESFSKVKEPEKERERLINIVKDHKNNSLIIGWCISNDLLAHLETSFLAPDLYYYKLRYLKWLQALVSDIKRIDTVHPVFLNVSMDRFSGSRIKDYQYYVGQIDQLIVSADCGDKKKAQDLVPSGNVAWGMVEPELWDSLKGNKNFIIPSWQDQETASYVTLDGLFDFQGRKKQAFDAVAKHWEPSLADKKILPEMKILRPSKLMLPESTLTYYALVKDQKGQWGFPQDPEQSGFEWYLVQVDQYESPVDIKYIGKGSSVSLDIPDHGESYRLYLKALTGKRVTGVLSKLNIPLN